MIYHTPKTISGKPNFLFSSNCKIKQGHICTLIVGWSLIVKKVKCANFFWKSDYKLWIMILETVKYSLCTRYHLKHANFYFFNKAFLYDIIILFI